MVKSVTYKIKRERVQHLYNTRRTLLSMKYDPVNRTCTFYCFVKRTERYILYGEVSV